MWEENFDFSSAIEDLIPAEQKTKQDQIDLAFSIDGTQKLRVRRDPGGLQLLSLDIYAGQSMIFPALTVSTDHEGFIRVSFTQVLAGSKESMSITYSEINNNTIRNSYAAHGNTETEADILLINGAYPERVGKQLPNKIKVKNVAKNIVTQFAALSQIQGGFAPVKVADIVDRLF